MRSRRVLAAIALVIGVSVAVVLLWAGPRGVDQRVPGGSTLCPTAPSSAASPAALRRRVSVAGLRLADRLAARVPVVRPPLRRLRAWLEQSPSTSRFRRSVVVAGLTAPTTLALLGPREFLLLEKDSGKVKHVREGRVVGTAIDLAVNSRTERGALGITLHPGFPRPPFVYIFWTWRGVGHGSGGLEGADSTERLDVDRLGNRIDRFTWDGTVLRFDRNLIRLPAVRPGTSTAEGSHNGGILRFGPDGKLYAVIGDQNLRGWLQNVPDGPPPAADHLAGVVLRLNLDGSTPGDNPFVAAGRALGGEVGANLQRVFAYGIRNSFGMAFDPMGGDLWMTENGKKTFDEINRVVPGFNSRWIQVMGPDACFGEYRRLETPPPGVNDPVAPPLAPTLEEARARLYQFPGSRPAEPAFSWKIAISPTSLTFLRGTALGEDLAGAMLVGDLFGRLYRFHLTPDRKSLALGPAVLSDRVANNSTLNLLAEGRSLVLDTNLGIITDLKETARGTLYVVSHSHRTVYELSRRGK